MSVSMNGLVCIAAPSVMCMYTYMLHSDRICDVSVSLRTACQCVSKVQSQYVTGKGTKAAPVVRAFDRELTDTSKKALRQFRR